MTVARAPASPPEAAYAVTGELTRDGDLLTGWCWSPDRGNARLRVSLLIDGAVVGSTVAARLRAHLVRDGVRDGYHGFSLKLPAAVAPHNLIEVREAATGQVFGRIVPTLAPEWQVAVEALEREAAHLHRQASALATIGPPGCLDAFGSVGGHLSQGLGFRYPSLSASR